MPRRRLPSISFLECAIALSLLAGAATVAIPRWTSRTITLNEQRAVDRLALISDAQQRFHQRCQTFALLSELSGERTSRGLDTLPRCLDMPPPRHGITESGGYLFTVYLPSDEGYGATGAGDVDPEAAESGWIAYAWPSHYGISGRRVFVATPDGEVFAHENSGAPLAGRDRAPFASLAWSTLTTGTPFQEPVDWVKQTRWEPVVR